MNLNPIQISPKEKFILFFFKYSTDFPNIAILEKSSFRNTLYLSRARSMGIGLNHCFILTIRYREFLKIFFHLWSRELSSKCFIMSVNWTCFCVNKTLTAMENPNVWEFMCQVLVWLSHARQFQTFWTLGAITCLLNPTSILFPGKLSFI